MADEEKLAPQQRSPAYPSIPLDVALERARKIYDEVRDHAQPREVIAKAYGKPATSSATQQTFSTLLQYGLLENVATANGRKMRVTALAQSMLNPHAPQAKVTEGRKMAALMPQIFAELWARFGDTAGLNENVPLYYLTQERGIERESVFTDKAAREVLRIYRETLEFAGVAQRKNSQDVTDSTEEELPPPRAVKVGDFAQAEVNGAFQFKEPKRVEEIREQDGKSWVFFEGENAAVEMSQTILQDAPANLQERPTPPLRGKHSLKDEAPDGWSEEILIDDGGNEIKIRYHGKAALERYEFIRDYLDFKIKRLSGKASQG